MNTPSAHPLPPHIRYLGGQLAVEQRVLDELARKHGTPLFVYSQAAMLEALGSYQRALAGREHLICYAMKANSTLGILQTLVRAGCGLDIVSGGELERALAVGVAPDRIIFSGVGKTRAEMRRALTVGIGCFNVESRAELDVLDAVAQAAGTRAPVSIRVNPNVDAKTHPYISTGLKGNKFGVAHEDVVAWALTTTPTPRPPPTSSGPSCFTSSMHAVLAIARSCSNPGARWWAMPVSA